ESLDDQVAGAVARGIRSFPSTGTTPEGLGNDAVFMARPLVK
ncbi:MAG: hypothetical protein K0S37_3869, partial [Microbacterium sp.]|nr:hypothetical protein [Microbacterium sp.]